MDWVAQHPENLTQQLHDLNGLWDRATIGSCNQGDRATKGIVRLVTTLCESIAKIKIKRASHPQALVL